MIFPSFNPSTNTLPITGSTLTLTSTGVQIVFDYDGSHRASLTCGSGGEVILNQQDALNVQFCYQGTPYFTWGGNNACYIGAFAYFFVDTGANYDATRPRFRLNDGGGVTDGGAASRMGLSATGAASEIVLTTTLFASSVPIKVPGGTNALLTTATTATSGEGASLGTLTNAPSAGNPTSWMKVNDNGTTRYIPAW